MSEWAVIFEANRFNTAYETAYPALPVVQAGRLGHL
jgi:hypothetical protein